MPDDSLQVYRGAGLAGSQVLWLSQGGGICGGPDINLENKILIARDGEGKLEAPVLLLDKSLDWGINGVVIIIIASNSNTRSHTGKTYPNVVKTNSLNTKFCYYYFESYENFV